MLRDSDVDSSSGSTSNVFSGLGWLLGICVGPRPRVETLTDPLLQVEKESLDHPKGEQLKATKGDDSIGIKGRESTLTKGGESSFTKGGESGVTKGGGSKVTKGDQLKTTQPETACRLMRNASPHIPKYLQLGPDAQLVYMKDASVWVRPSHLCVCRCSFFWR
jgi:hypothetical protein